MENPVADFCLGLLFTLISVRKSANYSRKPGFTETRLRPLARRRDSTACPLLVFIRERKPCFFTRLRRLGWNVRFGMETHELLTGKMALRQTLSIKDAS